MFDEMVNKIHVDTASVLMKMPYYSVTAEQRKRKEEQAERARNAAISKGNMKSFVRNKKRRF